MIMINGCTGLVRFQQLRHAFLHHVKREAEHGARGNQPGQIGVSVRIEQSRRQISEHVSFDCRQLKREVQNGQHERRLNFLVKSF